jgi:hypothetical protein
MRGYTWIVELKVNGIWCALLCRSTRDEARNYADYYNGFSKGTRGASYRARKYEAVK